MQIRYNTPKLKIAPGRIKARLGLTNSLCWSVQFMHCRCFVSQKVCVAWNSSLDLYE